MMKRTIACLTALLILAIVPHGVTQVARPDQPPSKSEPKPESRPGPTRAPLPVEPAEWAPPEALLYLGVTNVTETWAAFKETAAYRMMSDASATGAAPELGVFGSLFEDFKKRLAQVLAVEPEQLKNPFAGPLCFYLVAPPGGKPEDLEPGLIAGVGDADQMKKYYDTVVAKLKETATHEAVSADADTIDTFRRERAAKEEEPQAVEGEEEPEESGEGGPGPFGPFGPSPEKMFTQALDELFSPDNLPERLAMCLTRDRLVVGGSVDQVKAILRREKSGRTLLDTDDHKALLRHLRPTGTIRLLVNLPRVIALAKAARGETEAEDLRKWLQVIGAESLGSMVGHWKLGASSYDSKVELLFLMSGQRSGLAKLLSMENRPSTPPANIPGDTCIYGGLNANVPQSLDEIERILRQADPAKADQFRASMEIELPDGGKANLRKDFLDHLQAPFTVTFGLVKPLGLNCARLLLGIGQRDQNAVVRFLSNPAVTQMPLTPREMRGAQVFDVPPMPPFLPGGLALAATTDRLVIGNLPAVEDALVPVSAEPLGETEGWKRVARFVPDESWLTIYVDNYKLLSAIIDLAKKRDELMAGAGAMDISSVMVMAMLESLGGGAAGGDVRPMEKLLKYSSQAVYTIGTTPEGVQFTAVQLKPE